MKTLGMVFFLLIWRAEASYILCSESVSVYETLQCTIPGLFIFDCVFDYCIFK